MTCPVCGVPLSFVEELDIFDHEHRWLTRVERYDCAAEHVILVAEAATPIDDRPKPGARNC